MENRISYLLGCFSMIKISTLLAWFKAARLPSQSYIFFPLLLGQALAVEKTGTYQWIPFLLVQAFGIANQLYIVFANDYADQETDAKNETFTLFSGGSRVLVSQSLSPQAILLGAKVSAFICLLISGLLAFLPIYAEKNPRFLILCLVALFLLYAYSYSPFQLSYRGGGELLQMLGVGFVLPLYGFLGQGGSVSEFPYSILVFFLPLHWGTAILTSLPDEPSDRFSSKNTMTVLLGSRLAKILILSLYFLSGFLFYWSNPSYCKGFGFLPIFVLLIALFFVKGKPGELKLSLFLFFGILFHLSLELVWFLGLQGILH